MKKDFYKTYFEVEKKHWWFRVRRDIIFWLLNKHNVSKSARIFDFGCGSGYLVGELQKLGHDASGSDMSQEAIELGRQRGVRNIQAVKPGEMPQSDSFDIILALDVIEHIEDDIGAIRGLKRALKPEGILIITVPAYQWMWGVQDEVAHHFRRYDMSSLLKLVGNDNSVVIKKSYFNTFLFPPIAAVRLVSKLFKIKERESDFDINNQLLNKFFYWIFRVESKLLKFFNFPFGVSILTVLKNER